MPVVSVRFKFIVFVCCGVFGIFLLDGTSEVAARIKQAGEGRIRAGGT
jgi:hypothetical protein